MAGEVRVHHHPHELLEASRSAPSRAAVRALDRIGHEHVDFGRPHEPLVAARRSPASRGRPRRTPTRRAAAPTRSARCRSRSRSGVVLLQHAPHRVDVVARESPVAPRVEVAERAAPSRVPSLMRATASVTLRVTNSRPRRSALVIEQDPGHRVQPEALAIVHRDPVAVHLGDAVRAPRIERRRLALRRLDAPCRTSRSSWPGRSAPWARPCASPRACASRRAP